MYLVSNMNEHIVMRQICDPMLYSHMTGFLSWIQLAAKEKLFALSGILGPGITTSKQTS